MLVSDYGTWVSIYADSSGAELTKYTVYVGNCPSTAKKELRKALKRLGPFSVAYDPFFAGSYLCFYKKPKGLVEDLINEVLR